MKYSVMLVCAISLYAQDYPQGFRKWTHVKTAVVGPQSPFFKSGGGIHHVYANGKAMEGFEAGAFPDGSVLVFDLLEAKEADGHTTEGPRQRVDVMIKDSKRFSASGGWGFERFLGDSQTDRPLDAEHRGQCFTCHLQRKNHDLVFSEFRK
jgi:Cytochrome P460